MSAWRGGENFNVFNYLAQADEPGRSGPAQPELSDQPEQPVHPEQS